jgi:hypothetical protein
VGFGCHLIPDPCPPIPEFRFFDSVNRVFGIPSMGMFVPVVGMILVFDEDWPLDVFPCWDAFRWRMIVEGIIYRVFSRERSVWFGMD